MVEKSKLSLDELNKRAAQVFDLQQGDYIWSIEVEDGKVNVEMEEEEWKSGKTVIFTYKPNMKKRPQALAYLLGKRGDFND